MKTIYLLRHATSEPRATVFADYDRPLTSQGQEEAQAVAAYIQKKKLTFDFVMCSAALRAQETLEPLRAVVGTREIEISQSFYNISEQRILECVRRINDDKHKILYIGHNPGIAFAILKFSQTIPPILGDGINPATLVGMNFPDENWINLEWRTAQVVDVFQPSLPRAILEQEGL